MTDDITWHGDMKWHDITSTDITWHHDMTSYDRLPIFTNLDSVISQLYQWYVTC